VRIGHPIIPTFALPHVIDYLEGIDVAAEISRYSSGRKLWVILRWYISFIFLWRPCSIAVVDTSAFTPVKFRLSYVPETYEATEADLIFTAEV
jgi:hypothetical protein